MFSAGLSGCGDGGLGFSWVLSGVVYFFEVWVFG